MTGPRDPTRGRDSSPLRVALVVADVDWGHTQAAGLAAAETDFQPSVRTDPATLLDAVGEFDCIVVEGELSPPDTAALCELGRTRRPPVPLVLVLGSAVDVADVTAVEPTDYYLRGEDEPSPQRLARRIETVVGAVHPGSEPPPAGRFRAFLTSVPTPIALTDGTGDVVSTNPAFTATFGLANRLPSGLPDPVEDGAVDVDCDTLEGSRPFRYGRIRIDDDVVCHVLCPQPPAGEVADQPSMEAPSAGGEEDSRREGLPLESLTDRQREVLRTAVDGGFFDRPKAHNADELAARLDIARSTFLQHLRAAQRKCFERTFD